MSVLIALRVSLVTVAASLLTVVPQLRFCRQSPVSIRALFMVKMEAVLMKEFLLASNLAVHVLG